MNNKGMGVIELLVLIAVVTGIAMFLMQFV